MNERPHLQPTPEKKLLDIWEQRYRPLQLQSATDNGIRLWKIMFRMFDRFLQREGTIADLNDDTVSKFCTWRKNKGAAPATVNRDLMSILALWRWCHRMGMVSDWPTVKKYPEPIRTPIAWTEDQFNTLLKAAALAQGDMRGGQIRFCDFWTALLLMAFDTGERIGALLSVEWQDVDLDQRFVRFRAETRKGRRRDHLLEFSAETAAAIEKIRPRLKKGTVFPWPYSINYIWLCYGELLQSAGLPSDRSRKFHCVRKTTASYVEAAGGDATKTLGHASRATTERYIDQRIARVKPAYTLLFRPQLSTTQQPPKITREQEQAAVYESLAQYFRIVHAPRRSMAATSIADTQQTIRRLERFTGRSLRVTDLTMELLRQWTDSMLPTYAYSSIQSECNRVIALWSSAHEWGFVATPAPRAKDMPALSQSCVPDITDEELAAADTSLIAFFERVYAKRREIKEVPQVYYTTMIKRLERITGRTLTVHDISQPLVDSFLQKIAETLPDSTVEKNEQYINTIWAAAHEWGFIETAPPNQSEVTR